MSYAPGQQAEVILFFGVGGICKGLLYSDFEAVLDGVVGMQEFAGREMRAAYVTVNGRLLVTGIVLFTISFDEQGGADRTWNIPLRHMLEKADRGPDLGAGPVRLACRSQCPISWQQSQLWDPNMKQGENDFVFIRDTIRDRGSYLGLTYQDDPEPAPRPVWTVPPAAQAAPAPIPAVVPPVVMPAPAVPPVIATPAPVPPADSWAQAAAIPAAPAAAPGGDAIDQLREERMKLARTIKDLRLQVTTMETQQTEELAKLNYAFQQKEEILNSQLEKLLSQFKSLKAQNGALREQTTAQRAQIDTLHDALDRQTDASLDSADAQNKVEEVRQQVQREMAQRLEEETAKLREELHVREMDLISRDEKLEALKDEIAELRRSNSANQEAGADKFLDKLEKLGVSFIAFHPGAGHVSIPFKQIQRYVENPLAFAAEKCLVTEDRYRGWLAHYESPVCGNVKADGKACGARLIRVDVPSKFKPGDSDICPKCQGDKNIANVLAFR